MIVRSMLKALCAGSWLWVGLVLSSPAHAQEPAPGAQISGAEVTLAETLYREGRRLMGEQRHEEACGKFAESHRLDPATGTLLNLAACHEALGKLASAWLEFSDAARIARREQREDRVRFAEEHIQAIEPRLSRLTISVTPTSGTTVKIKLDGFMIGPAAYGLAAPIDPGTHSIEAFAEGYKTWTTRVVVGEDADQQQVSVPALEPEPLSVTPPSESAAASSVQSNTQALDLGAVRPIPPLVYVTGATTLALTAGAVVTGLLYVRKKKDFDAAPRGSDERGNLYTKAETLGWLNGGLSAAALIGAGVTVVLYSTRPEQRRSGRATPHLSAWVLPSEGGLSLSSEF